MAVGGETAVPLRPRPPVVVQVTAHPIRHFAKPPGVIRQHPLVRCVVVDKTCREVEHSMA